MTLRNDTAEQSDRTPVRTFGGGALIGALGGLIGLGGVEFRLPLLIAAFRVGTLEAVILNKAMSLGVVASVLPFRASSVPISEVLSHWPIIVNLPAGSLLGAAPRRLGNSISVLAGRYRDRAVLAHDTLQSRPTQPRMPFTSKVVIFVGTLGGNCGGR